MKKAIAIIVFGLLWCNISFAAGYKYGKGPLKITKYVANTLEYYFSEGKKGVYARKQKDAWKPSFIVISSDGRHQVYYVTPIWYGGNIMSNNYVGMARKQCKKESGKECFVFANFINIVGENGREK